MMMMMAYKNDSNLVILNRYGKMNGDIKAELYETWDRIRDLTVSGPTIGATGLGKISSLLMNVARSVSGSPFLPTFGSEAILIPGTSYYGPQSGGTGGVPASEAAFGLSPFAHYPGFDTSGSLGGAAPLSGLSRLTGGGGSVWNTIGRGMAGVFTGGGVLSTMLASRGIGAMPTAGYPMSYSGIGSMGMPVGLDGIGGDVSEINDMIGFDSGSVAGAASPLPNGWVNGATGLGVAAGTLAGAGFGRNWVMPLAGIASGFGGLLTTLGPFLGPWGSVAMAAGSIVSGLAGAAQQSFQHIQGRLLANADTIMTQKIKNLEMTGKMLDAQEDILKKLLKDEVEGDKKLLENL